MGEPKQNLVSRLNRIEGQIRGVKGMVERDAHCDDVLNQLAAVQSALQSVGRLLIEDHLKSCLAGRVQAGEDEVVEELLSRLKKLLK